MKFYGQEPNGAWFQKDDWLERKNAYLPADDESQDTPTGELPVPPCTKPCCSNDPRETRAQ